MRNDERKVAFWQKLFPRIAALWSAFAGLAFFAAATAHVAFPVQYHWDEGPKARQILTGQRDLCHPPLLLNTAGIVHALAGTGATYQEATHTGRICAAAYGALAVGLFAWLAFRTAGLAAAIFAGVLVALNPMLFELAHYFKEDTCLLAGWAAVLAATEAYRRHPSRPRAAWAGGAAAFALSGKYIGVLPALAALGLTGFAIVRHEPARGERAWRLGLLALTTLLLTAVFNYQALSALGTVAKAVQIETIAQMSHDTGLKVWPLVWQQNGAAVIVLAAAGVILSPAFRRPGRSSAWAAVVLAALYLLLILQVRRGVSRYLLPVNVTLAWMAGLGVAALVRGGLPDTLRRLRAAGCVAGLLVFGAAVAHLGRQTVDQARAFASRGTRAELQAYIAQHLPAEAVVAYDVRVVLTDPKRPGYRNLGPALRQRVVEIPQWKAKLGPSIWTWLREQGVTHVAVTSHYMEYYLAPGFRATAGQFSDLPYRRDFYLRLRREASIVWEDPGMANLIVTPGLRLYALPPALL